MVKNLPAMQETWVPSLGAEDALEKEMATHLSILAWNIPWMEQPGRLQSIGSQRVGHDLETKCKHTHTHTHKRERETQENRASGQNDCSSHLKYHRQLKTNESVVVMVWDFKEKEGNSHGGGKASVW